MRRARFCRERLGRRLDATARSWSALPNERKSRQEGGFLGSVANGSVPKKHGLKPKFTSRGREAIKRPHPRRYPRLGRGDPQIGILVARPDRRSEQAESRLRFLLSRTASKLSSVAEIVELLDVPRSSVSDYIKRFRQQGFWHISPSGSAQLLATTNIRSRTTHARLL